MKGIGNASKRLIFAQKWQSFDPFWPYWRLKKISKFFGRHLSHMETQLHTKKSETRHSMIGSPERVKIQRS